HQRVLFGTPFIEPKLLPTIRTIANFSLRQICSAKYTAYCSEYVVKLRQRAHLISQAPRPECLEPRLFLQNRIFETCGGLTSKFEFLADGLHQMIQIDALVDRQVPKIIEVSRFVPCSIGQSECLLGRVLFQ